MTFCGGATFSDGRVSGFAYAGVESGGESCGVVPLVLLSDLRRDFIVFQGVRGGFDLEGWGPTRVLSVPCRRASVKRRG